MQIYVIFCNKLNSINHVKHNSDSENNSFEIFRKKNSFTKATRCHSEIF